MDRPGEIRQGQSAPNLIDISDKPSPFSMKNRIMRVLWGITYVLLFRPSPRPLHGWRRILLRLFGAKLGRNAKVFSSAKIWAPWNLEMGDFSTIAPDVDCYSAARIRIGSNTTVSQYSYLCAASHDFRVANMPLFTKPIDIGSQVWICADVFVGPGVAIQDGVVVGARSSVFRDLPAWTVCVGTPAEPRGPREVKAAGSAPL